MGRTGDYLSPSGLRSLPQLHTLKALRGGRVPDDPWLRVGDVVDMLRAAGYTDSRATVSRAIDAGRYGKQGTDWYRTDGQYRMVRCSAVRANIARRQSPDEPNG